VVNAVNYFEKLFGIPLPNDRLWATLIQGGHGQAFDGFLHLSELAAFREDRGTTEKFLAHEVAHEWWGHLVGWSSYRDQWLSEGLADYSALLFLEAVHPRGENLFREALTAYADEILGSSRAGTSGFSRGAFARTNLVGADRIGPIGHGLRAATGEAPTAYLSLAYHKAALVLHMLRVLSRFTPRGEVGFIEALRDFAKSNLGGWPTTGDLVDAVERQLPGEWDWFFDQWIERAEIPAYRWRAEIAPAADAEGMWTVTLRVEQEGVSESFRMPVPVKVEFRDRSESVYLVVVDGAEVVKELRLPKRPAKVTFNPDREILARM
jgi:aminopeptidase N